MAQTIRNCFHTRGGRRKPPTWKNTERLHPLVQAELCLRLLRADIQTSSFVPLAPPARWLCSITPDLSVSAARAGDMFGFLWLRLHVELETGASVRRDAALRTLLSPLSPFKQNRRGSSKHFDKHTLLSSQQQSQHRGLIGVVAEINLSTFQHTCSFHSRYRLTDCDMWSPYISSALLDTSATVDLGTESILE